MVAGEEVGDIHIANRTYDVNVWSTPETRNSLSALRDLPIDTPGGGIVRLPGCRRRGRRAHAERDQPRARRASHRRGRQRARAGARRRLPRRGGRPGEDRVPAGVLPGPDGRIHRASERAAEDGDLRAHCRIRRVPAAPRLVQERAAGDCCPFCCCPPRWWAACWPPIWATALSRSVRSSASSRCSASPRATASC